MKELFEKFLANKCNEQESQKVLEFLTDENFNSERDDLLQQWLKEMQFSDGDDVSKKKLIQNFKGIEQKINRQDNNVKYLAWRRLNTFSKVAAIVSILLTSACLYYFSVHYKVSKKSGQNLAISQNDINPGYYKATLSLGKGRQLALDSSSHNNVLDIDNMVLGNSNGILSYQSCNDLNNHDVHTLTTPRSGQYQLILSDGTKVWLNASSSIQYPAVFTGKTRDVTVSGEVYFEVAKNLAKPFIAHIDNTEVKVLGTYFDINGYADDGNIHTTLLEGSIKMKYFNNEAFVKPGQKATCTGDREMEVKECDDIDNVIDWKKELFTFKDLDIRLVMKQLSRWYDFEPVFKTKVYKHFWCSISRKVPLSHVLNTLQATGEIKFKIENKKVYIMS